MHEHAMMTDPGDPWGEHKRRKTASPFARVTFRQQLYHKLRGLMGLEAKTVHWSIARMKVSKIPEGGSHIASRWWFNTIVVVCICIDSVLVGVESDQNRGDAIEDRLVFWFFDIVFNVVYVTEMCTRINQQRWEYFADPWNIFDYICVSLGCTAIVQPLVTETSAGSGQADIVNLRVMKALKGFRLLRLLRVVRLIVGLKIIEGLLVLVSGLLASMRTLFWVGVFCLIMLYSFGCALSVATDDPMLRQNWNEYDMYLGSIFRAFLTVWQICTFDHWIDIARPIIASNPFAGIFIFLSILICNFGVLNVMLSVMVESIRAIFSINKHKADAKLEETEKRLLSIMEREFRKVDYEENGWLEYKEFCALLRDEPFAFKLRLFGVQYQEAHQLFYLMDVDGLGHVTWAEFSRGLRKLRGAAMGNDLVKIINFATKNRRDAIKYVERVRVMSEQVDAMQARLNDVGQGIVKQLEYKKGMDKSRDKVMAQAKQREVTVRRLHYDMQVNFPQKRH